MEVLTQEDIQKVSGGEAGVPHSDYYYGPYFATDGWSNFVDGLLDWLDAALSYK